MKRTARAYPKPLPEPYAKTLRLMWSKMSTPKGCWEWTGSLLSSGYPQSIAVNGSGERNLFRPQRLMFHWFKYPIPDGFVVDHLCKNHKCVNPDHMEDITHELNVARGLKRKYCKRGHPQTQENRYAYSSHGRRRERCKPCMLRRKR